MLIFYFLDNKFLYVTGSVSSGGVVSEEFSARTDESGRMCALDIKTVDQSHLGKFFM